MPTKTTPLTPTSKKLISAFDEAARDWGYQINEGYGAAFNRSEKEYVATTAALKDHVSKLERKVRRLTQELRKATEGTTPKHLRREMVQAKAAITTSHIKVTRPDGRVETVKNPFYSGEKA